ncbi:MAG: gliding motility-associated C-terminal domain-containing protein, partial [Bacteroidia bacterium]
SNSGGTAGIASSTNVNCNGSSSGTATASITGGTGPFTYSWSPAGGTAVTASNLTSGTYTCTITDANNCVTSSTVSITQPAAFAVSTTTTASSCGTANGSATANVSGGTVPYTYSWNTTPVQTTATATAITAGSYSVTITDSKGCLQSIGVSVNSNSGGTAGIASSANVLCNGGSTGSATASISGGTGPFTYSWSPTGGTAVSASNLPSGNYTCTITDANGCVSSSSVTLTQPTVLTDTTALTAASCGMNNGAANTTVSGGSGGYAYSWSPSGGIAATASNLAPGTYTCTITDTHGCSLQTVAVITTSGAAPVASITASGPTTFCQGSTVTLTATGGGTYSWSNGATTAGITVSTAGTYSVTVTNGCGSNSTASVITVNPLPLASVTGGGTICHGDSLLLTASGGASYSWSTGQTGTSIYAAASGTYTVTASNGCGTSSAVTTVNVGSVTAGFTADSTSGNASLTVHFTNTSSASATTWSWNFGDGSTATGAGAVHTFGTGGTYTVVLTVTNATGCTDTYSMLITVSDQTSWIHFPDVFTPNGDGSNDLFLFPSMGITEFDVIIYDRWGVQLSELRSPDDGWDGRTIAGEPASNGTYYYILKAKGADKKVYNHQGWFMLFGH